MTGFEQTPADVPETLEETLPTETPAQQDDREYDRRGVALPRRAKVGGIITPQ